VFFLANLFYQPPAMRAEGDGSGKQDGGHLLAPNTLCLPDCFDDEWEPPGPPHMVEVYFGPCTLRVHYKTRKACGVFCDLIITNIQNYSGSNPYCAGLPVSQVVDIATVQAIRDAMDNDRPDESCKPKDLGDCITQWRVSNAACWRYNLSGLNPGTNAGWHGSWGICDQMACCFNLYQVCLDSIGNTVVTRTSQTQNYDCPVDNPGCVPACGR
jgi:hypothetical protein